MIKIDNSKVQVVSFSGGRTSAYMVWLIESMRKSGEWSAQVEYIFMDTGSEHPKTYEFIKKCVEHFGIELTCLRGDFNQPVGVGHEYKVIDVNEIEHDMKNGPFAQLMRKYGVPHVMSAFCTTRMKEDTFRKYCEEKYGKGNYVTWLGIRYDEPSRLVGSCEYQKFKSAGLSDLYIARCFSDAANGAYCENPVIKSLAYKKQSSGLNYMAQITDFEKDDVLDFWSGMPFDLEIQEHQGNCVFCIKKSINKLALAARDEPELLSDWLGAIDSASDRLNQPIEKTTDGLFQETYTQHIKKGIMYRGSNSVESIIAKFALHSRDEIYDSIRSMKRKESGGCTESCEAFANQLELL